MRRSKPVLIVLLTVLWFLGSSVQGIAGYLENNPQGKSHQHSNEHHPIDEGSLSAAASSNQPHNVSAHKETCCLLSQTSMDCSQYGFCKTSCPSSQSSVLDLLTTTEILSLSGCAHTKRATTTAALLQFRFYPPDTPPP